MTICGVIAPNATPNGSPVACAWQPGHLPEKPHSWADLPTFIEPWQHPDMPSGCCCVPGVWDVNCAVHRANPVPVEQPPTQDEEFFDAHSYYDDPGG